MPRTPRTVTNIPVTPAIAQAIITLQLKRQVSYRQFAETVTREFRFNINYQTVLVIINWYQNGADPVTALRLNPERYAVLCLALQLAPDTANPVAMAAYRRRRGVHSANEQGVPLLPPTNE